MAKRLFRPLDDTRPPPSSWAVRFGWLVLIWVLSIGALALFALLLRVVMGWVGLSV